MIYFKHFLVGLSIFAFYLFLLSVLGISLYSPKSKIVFTSIGLLFFILYLTTPLGKKIINWVQK